MKIAITGASGSLGRRLVYYCAKQAATERIVALIRSEYALALHHDLFKKLLPLEEFERIHWMLGDIRDQARLEKAFRGCDTVVHAAALKRVDSILENPTEIIRTNIDGLVKTLEAAMAINVKKFVFISSDKAVSPENSYGASKMLGEDLVRSFNSFSLPRGMACLSVRYGNVLGSRGSVYWLWRKELEKNYPIIHITDKSMTRFFMTFDMAIDTIVTALEQGEAGQTIVPSCQAYLLMDFLAAMIDVLTPDKKDEVKIQSMGVRKGGEKYHESLCHMNQVASGFSTILRDSAAYTVFPGEVTSELVLSSYLLSSNVLAFPANRMSVGMLRKELVQFEMDALNEFDKVPHRKPAEIFGAIT